MSLFELCLRSVRRSKQSSRSLLAAFGSSIARSAHQSVGFVQPASFFSLRDYSFLSVPAYGPFDASCQDVTHERRRNFTSTAMEHSENRLDDPLRSVVQSEVPAASRGKAHASPETMDDAENERMSLQHVSSSESDEDCIASEELSEDDASQRIALAEKEFFDLIKVEESADELLSMLLKLEQAFPLSDPRVCHTCLRLAILCNDSNQQPEKIVDYARQAFHNFDSSKFPLESAKALFLVGLGYYKIGDSKEAVTSLERCAYKIGRLELLSAHEEEINLLQCNCQLTLGQAKVSLGLNVEGLSDLRKSLAAMEKAFLPDDVRLANCYQEAALSFLHAKEPKDALGFCTKAVLVFSRSLGLFSVHVADIRSLMSKIYHELGDVESALFECQQAVQIFNALGETNKATRIQLESIQAYFLLGRLEEAVIKLKEIVKKLKQEDPLHVEALILLVNAFISLEDEIAAAEHSQMALNSLEQKELNFDSAQTLIKLATCFQQLHNFDNALAISQRALAFFEKCTGEEALDYVADVRGYRGSLFLAIGKHSEALLDLEKALELKKSIYGLESVELLNLCNHLGVAYAHAGKVDEALAVLQDAKSILSVTNIGVNLTSIYIYNNLALTCILSGRIGEARETKRHAVCMIREASSEVSLSADETEKELENLIKAKEAGMTASISSTQVLKQMLPTFMTT